MKQPIIAAMRALTSAYILSMLLWQASSASEHTTADDQPTTLTYNGQAIAKLQEVFDNTNDLNYKENSLVLRRLVEQEHADPNIKYRGDSGSLLYEATTKNDTAFVVSLMAHRADPNPSRLGNPIFTAKSTEVAQLLVNAKADIHALGFCNGNVLHHAAMYGASAEVITFWYNAGVNAHLKNNLRNTPLLTLFQSRYITPDKIVPFLWTETDVTSKDTRYIETLEECSPSTAVSFKALITVVPQVKAEKAARYEQTKALLINHLNQDVMPLVMGYTSPLSGPLYDVRYFKQDIEPRMLAGVAAEEANNRSSKRIKVSPQVQS